jgi:predicted nucleic acid-binding Zn ribbon protein
MSTGPDTWGPHGWKFIHFIALGYPNNPDEKDKEKYKTFFYLFGDMIPCVLCANHYKKNLEKINIDLYLNSKDDLIHWTILMHNEVNKSNGKKIYTFEEGINMIIDRQGPIKCTENCENVLINNTNKYNETYNYILIGFLITIIILLILYIYKRNLT